MRVNISYKVYPNGGDAFRADAAWHISTRFRNVGTVGTRSRAIRGSTSDDRVGCSASEGRYGPARPALHVSPRLSPFLPCALASADCIGPAGSAGLFHYGAFCERAGPDAPEPIDDQRRCTRCRLSVNLRRLPRERVPTIAVGRDLHGFFMLAHRLLPIFCPAAPMRVNIRYKVYPNG